MMSCARPAVLPVALQVNKRGLVECNRRGTGAMIYSLTHRKAINSKMDLRPQQKFPTVKKEQKTADKLVLEPLEIYSLLQ